MARYGQVMRSHLRFLIAGAVVAGLIPGVAAAAPNDLDRAFGDGGVVVDRGVAFETLEGLAGVRIGADGRTTLALGQRCGAVCATLALTRYSPAGRRETVPAAWRGLPVSNGHPAPEVLTGWGPRDDRGLDLSYRGGDPATWTTGDVRRLPAEAPAGPFLLRLPAGGGAGAITPLPWRFHLVDAMADGGRVGWAPDRDHTLTEPEETVAAERWVGLIGPDGAPVAGFGTGGRVRVPDERGAVLGVAGGDAVRVATGDAGGLHLWTLRPGPTGWRATSGSVPVVRLAGAQAYPGGVDVAADGRSVVWRHRGGHDGNGVTDIAVFGPGGAVRAGVGSRRGLRVRGTWTPRIQADGKLVLTAFASDAVRVRRVNADGSGDPSFPITRIPLGDHCRVGASAVAITRTGRIVVTQGLARRGCKRSAGFLLARLRGGDAPAMRLAAPTRPRVNVARMTATSSMAGRARITVRQAGRVVGATDVRFTRGSQRAATARLRGATRAPLAVRATFRGTPAIGSTVIPAAR